MTVSVQSQRHPIGVTFPSTFRPLYPPSPLFKDITKSMGRFLPSKLTPESKDPELGGKPRPSLLFPVGFF